MKLALWVGCAGITMMFAAFSSAYIVRQSAGNWLEFSMPTMFYYSAGIIVLSSICVQASYWCFNNGKGSLYRFLLLTAFALGIGFMALQYQAWQQLAEMGIGLVGNPSGAFVIVIALVHAAHVVGGIGVLFVAVLHAFMLDYYVTAKRKLRFDLTITYWHFLGFLWIYLLLFFVLQQN